ncbi:hypothetical protein JCGZ_01639 [Jatropha curcas]|uniref:Exocyst subunit Exo70 family protein n=1 Tax=Jatropha curcas TaxID=180498 RepID=A0A067LCU8_JATCU|nr:exocyst complex component EXO70B1 [Jatropha curcas]KDP42315.1 hypothetical protein JCGZ_01639 [Jatropha curcas]
MDKNPSRKSSNFPRSANGDTAAQEQVSTDGKPEMEETDHIEQSIKDVFSFTKFNIDQAMEDVDRYVETLSKTNDKSNPPEIPSSVDSLLKMLEKEMANFDYKKVGQNQEAQSLFCQCLTRVSKLTNVFNEFTANPSIASSLNRASTITHLVVSLLDNEFRKVLESCNQSNNSNIESKTTPKASKQSSFSSHNQEFDPKVQSESESPEEEEFPAYTQQAIYKMSRLASSMISLGYESECCMAYNMVRRNAFNSELDRLGFHNISIEDVQRMQWETVEGEISLWIEILNQCSSILFPIEQKLCNNIFTDHPSIAQRLFGDFALAVTVRFLNFAEAVALSKRSAEKLFKFLDMYEALRDMIPAIENIHSQDLKSEIYAAKGRLREAAVSIFGDLENSIKRDNGRTPVPSGAVHPLTRYTMNYLEYACEYKDTLEQVFREQLKTKGTSTEGESDIKKWDAEINKGGNEDGTPKTSPFAVQLNKIMDLLDENLEMKSKLYRDPALRNVFLMNNGRYILQKIKGSNDINDIMGAQWCRKRSYDLRQYHKGYTRETWGRLLQCLSHEGLQVNGKVSKPVLKERFKMFNSMFDEIHKTQSTWVVSDEQLQSELRVSISAVVIPAYRSFLGRFQQYFSPGRQSEKYIKYQPEDIENAIDGLFDGNPTSMTRRK